jgi:cysteinyl-tRNA synthetase
MNAGTVEITVYNTLGRRFEVLHPRAEGEISIYVCGPTVQSEPHVGHGRSAVAFDVIRRYLAWRGFDVTFVRNVTDVEDKIIAAAAEEGIPAEELVRRTAGSFAEGYRALGVLEPDVEPKATEHIPEMLELIGRLVDRGLAYPAGDGDVYFAVRAFERYGRLSGHRVDELRAGARVEVSDLKHDPLDFALWKAAKPGEPTWDSPWGPGRPGWHIECSAMATRYLGDGFDIHGGGTDLIFPHHENEIAQSEAASGRTFARYWLHNGMVNLGGEKMSKSTGHLVDLHAAISRFGGMAVRLFYLRAHYRSPLEFGEALLVDAAAAHERINRFLERSGPPTAEADPEVLERFRSHMDRDFATPEAVGVLFDALRDANRALDQGRDAPGLSAAVHELVSVLGLDAEAPPPVSLDAVAGALGELAAELGLATDGGPEQVMERLLAARTAARAARDWPTADLVRDRLGVVGIVVEDTADGPRWLRR